MSINHLQVTLLYSTLLCLNLTKGVEKMSKSENIA
jgi:hypothetical protein